MPILIDTSGATQALEEMILRAGSRKNVQGLMILACDENGFTPETVDKALRAASLPIFGGVFPLIVHGRKLIRRGSMVIGLPQVIRTCSITGLSREDTDFEKAMEDSARDLGGTKTMMVFIDGFARRIGAFLENLYDIFGLGINYIGGGAGSLSMRPKPCLFTNEGMIGDGCVMGLLGLESGIGVAHGWKPLSGPFRVTASEKNIVQSLDFRPAFELYHETVTAHRKKAFEIEDFFHVAKAYPFGISRMGSEQIVRDPVGVGENNSIVCVGEVPGEEFVSILHGDETSLIQAAAKALRLGKEAFPDNARAGIRIFMDCISRVLFLDDRFHKELEAVTEPEQELVGACTIGEIANCGTEFLEFYNKTAVLAVLEKT